MIEKNLTHSSETGIELRQKTSVKIVTYVKQKRNPKVETNKKHVSKHTDLQLKKHLLNRNLDI